MEEFGLAVGKLPTDGGKKR